MQSSKSANNAPPASVYLLSRLPHRKPKALYVPSSDEIAFMLTNHIQGPKARGADGEEEERRKKRAERFGTKRALPAETVDTEEAERRRKRAERFGLAP